MCIPENLSEAVFFMAKNKFFTSSVIFLLENAKVDLVHSQKVRHGQHVFVRKEGAIAGSSVVAAPSVKDAGGMLVQASDTHV